MSFEGVKISTMFKLRADFFHHTHEVWGPCGYRNAPLRVLARRVLPSYRDFLIFAPNFGPPSPPPVPWGTLCPRICTHFWSHFVKGMSGTPRGGMISFEGVKFS